MKLSALIRLLLAACASGALFSLTSCHTAAGFGSDVQHAGRGINRVANRAHP